MKVLSLIIAVICLLCTLGCASAQVGISSPIGRAMQVYYTDAGDYGTLNDAITAMIALGGGTLVVNSGISVTADLTVPSNVAIEAKKSGLISITSGKSLTINGPFNAGLYQVFSCTDYGSLSTKPCVMFCPQTTNMYASSGTNNADAITCSGNVKEVYPQWWGANPSNSTTDATLTKNAINAAIRSLNPNQADKCSGTTCNMTIGPGGVVKISGYFQVDGTINLTSGVALVGLGTSSNWNTYTASMNEQSTIYCAQTDGTDCVTAYVDPNMFAAGCTLTDYSQYQFNVSRNHGATVKGLRITGNESSGWGLVLGEPTKTVETYASYCAGTSYPWRYAGTYDAKVEDNIIDSHGKGGIHANCTAGSKFSRNWITGNRSHGFLSVWDNAGQTVVDNHIQNNCGTTSASCTHVGVANDPCYNMKIIYGGYGSVFTGNTIEQSGADGRPCMTGMTYIGAGLGVNYHGNYHEMSGPTTYLDGTASESADTITDAAHGLANGERVVFDTVVTGLTAGVHYYVVNKATDTFKVSTTSGGTAINITADGAVTYRRSQIHRGVTLATWGHGNIIRDNFFAWNTSDASLYCDAVYINPSYGSGEDYKILDTTVAGNTLTTDSPAQYALCNQHVAYVDGRHQYTDRLLLEQNSVRVGVPGVTAGFVQYSEPDTIYSGLTNAANVNIVGPKPVLSTSILASNKTRIIDALLNGGILTSSSNIKGLWFMDATGSTSTVLDRSGNTHNGSLKANEDDSDVLASAMIPSAAGTIPSLYFNGNNFQAADNDDFTFALSNSSPTPFSIIVLAKPHDLPPNYTGVAPYTNTLFSKYDATTGSEQREYRFIIHTDGSTNKLTWVQYDNAGNSTSRYYNTSIRSDVNEWHTYAITHNGTLADVATAVNLYYDATEVDDTGSGTITGMANTTSVPGNKWIYMNSEIPPAPVTGSFFGDYALALVVAEELTASQVARIDALLRGAAGDSLSTYVTPKHSVVDGYPVNVKNFGAKGDGVTDDYTAISNAITAAAGKTLYFPPGTYHLDTGLTFPATVNIHMEKGAILDHATGQVSIINGPLNAGLYQIFSCVDDEACVQFGTSTGNVYTYAYGTGPETTPTGVVQEVYPQWWGTVENSQVAADMTKNTCAINAAIRSLNPAQALTGSGSTYNMVLGNGGVVKITGRFEVNGTIKLKPKVSLVGIFSGRQEYHDETDYNSYIRCNQVDGTDCVTAILDTSLFEGDSTYQVCQLKTGYIHQQVELTNPWKVVIKDMVILGLDNKNVSQGYGIVFGDPPTWSESTTTDSVGINTYHMGWCGLNWTPTRSGYESNISGCVIRGHGKSGIYNGQAAGSIIHNNWIGQNGRNGIEFATHTNGVTLTNNHLQVNCSKPHKWYNTGKCSVATPSTDWVASSGDSIADDVGVDGSGMHLTVAGSTGYAYRTITGLTANTDYLFTVFFRRCDDSGANCVTNATVKIGTSPDDGSIHSSIALTGSPRRSGNTTTTAHAYYTRYLVKFNSGANTSITFTLGATTGTSYWDGTEIFQMPFNTVTNGTFTDTSGWTGSGATIAAVDGKLEVTDTSSGGGYAYYDVSGLTSGALYYVRYKYYLTDGQGKITIGTTVAPTSFYDGPTHTETDTYNHVAFVATGATTVRISLVSTEAGKKAYFDDVELYRLDTCVGLALFYPEACNISGNLFEPGSTSGGYLPRYCTYSYGGLATHYQNYHEYYQHNGLPFIPIYLYGGQGFTVTNSGFYTARSDQTPSCTMVYAYGSVSLNLTGNTIWDSSSATITSDACTMATIGSYAYGLVASGNNKYYKDPGTGNYTSTRDTDSLYSGLNLLTGHNIFGDDLRVDGDFYQSGNVYQDGQASTVVSIGTFTKADDVAYINLGDTTFTGQVTIRAFPYFQNQHATGYLEYECSFDHTTGLSVLTPSDSHCRTVKATGNIPRWYFFGPAELNGTEVRIPIYHDYAVTDEYQVLSVEVIARAILPNHAKNLIKAITVTAPTPNAHGKSRSYEEAEIGFKIWGREYGNDPTLADATLYLWADQGDDAGDKWAIQSREDTGPTNRLSIRVGDTEASAGEERFGCDINGVCRITGGEALAAAIELYADQGDDDADKWKIESQTDNDLSFQNNGVEKCKITTAGTMACTAFTGDGSGLTGIGVSISDTAYGASWDTVTTIGPSKNAVYDKVETLAPKDSPTFTTYVINRMGTTGGYKMMAAEATATLSGGSTTIQTNVPADSRVLGVQLRVDTAVTSGDGATSWTATYSGGLTSSITTSRPFAQNTKFNSLVGGDAASEVDIAITPDAHTFSGGVIRAIVYYETFVAMDSL